MIKVVSVFDFQLFLLTKIPREGNLFLKKVPTPTNSALNLERQSKAGFQKINEWKSITVNMGHKKGFAVSDGAA